MEKHLNCLKQINKVAESLSIANVRFTQVTPERVVELNESRDVLEEVVKYIKKLEKMEEWNQAKLQKFSLLAEEIKKLDIKDPKSFKVLNEKLKSPALNEPGLSDIQPLASNKKNKIKK